LLSNFIGFFPDKITKTHLPCPSEYWSWRRSSGKACVSMKDGTLLELQKYNTRRRETYGSPPLTSKIPSYKCWIAHFFDFSGEFVMSSVYSENGREISFPEDIKWSSHVVDPLGTGKCIYNGILTEIGCIWPSLLSLSHFDFLEPLLPPGQTLANL
jgi:hypothetical protein